MAIVSIANITRYTNPSSLGTDTFTIPATTKGNLLVVMCGVIAANGFWSTPQYVSANNDTLQEVPFFNLPVFAPSNAPFDMAYFSGSGVSADVWWCVSQGGSTSISFKCSGNPYFWVYELTGAATWALDDFEGSGASGPSQAPVVGPSVNGTATNDVYLAVVVSQNGNTTAVSSPWTLDGTAINGNAPAYILNGTGAHQATFTDSAGNDAFTIAAVSFKALAATCQLTVSTPSLAFSKDQCAAAPASQNVQVTNAGTSGPVAFAVNVNQPWVTFTPSIGVTPATVAIGVNPLGLKPGTYTATVSFASASCGIPAVTITFTVGQTVVASCIPDPNASAENIPSLNGVFTGIPTSGQVVNPPGFPPGTYNFLSYTQAGPDVTAFGGELFSTVCGREKIVMVVPDHYDDDGVGIDWQYEPWLAQLPPNVLQHAGFRAQLQGNGVIRMTPLNQKNTNRYNPLEVLLSESTPISFEKGLRATEKFLGVLFSNKKICGAFAIIQEFEQYANPKYAGSRSPRK